MPVEIAILKFFNIALANPALDVFFRDICDFSLWRWPVALVAILLLWKGGPKGRWLVILSVLTAIITDPTIHYLLKPLFGRLRPCHEAALYWIRLVDGCGGKYGFPSSHAANFFGQAVVVGLFYRSTRYYLYPLAVLVSIGRVYEGVHYPLDILGGAAFGAAAGLFVIYLARHFAPDRMAIFLRESRPISEDGESELSENEA